MKFSSNIILKIHIFFYGISLLNLSALWNFGFFVLYLFFIFYFLVFKKTIMLFFRFENIKLIFYFIKGSFILTLIFFIANYLGHPNNYLQTPVHIVPEWYFLPFYAILRSIPDKLIGVLFLIFSIVSALIFIFNGFIKKKYFLIYE